MYKICIFAGTLDGRRLAEHILRQDNTELTACVATEYGETLLKESENLKISAGRLSEEEMREMMEREKFDLVIDATHPYAVNVTKCISSACRESGTEYLRLLRENSILPAGSVYLENIEAAVEFLSKTEGNILLGTGSRDIAKYRGIRDFGERVYVRILPMESSLHACREAGIQPSHIIAMQGPFSQEMNAATLRAVNAAWFVTKDGGSAGGFGEKAGAAEKTGAALVVIGRPADLPGMGYARLLDELESRFGFRSRPEVSIVGIGPGSREIMTNEVREAIENADCLIGAERMLDASFGSGKKISAVLPEDIAEIIKNNRQFQHFCILMSGDTGFFSGCRRLLPLLSEYSPKILPGLSSLSCLCARLKTSYEDVVTVSLHGREHDIVPDVKRHRRVFTLVGGSDGINRLCRSLTEAGLGGVKLSVGERLSYPDERIVTGTAAELSEGSFDSLSAALIENEEAAEPAVCGLPDSVFLRKTGGEAAVPMTKSEVRAVCLSKLRLNNNSVCWDVGAGTGSVSVEMALQAAEGRVYAVEKRAAALELLKENRKKFGVENLCIIPGEAPEACRNLPAPDRAFIGGSSGNMKEIIKLLLKKNPEIRIVATAVSLETAAALTECMKLPDFSETEALCINISKSKRAGDYSLMTAGNPVYIFTMQGGEQCR
ncbi:MAG: precorrin-6A reductase [Candidatus Limivicinus sp.]|jgi:precorrin-6Y C5,15-methyltransferase (decarboxylating)